METVTGDRTADLSPLDGREFDAVIDVACYAPETARLSAEAFRDRTGRYVFVSTVSVYADQSTTEAQLEDAPLAQLKPDSTDFAENYGANKALCEGIIREVFGDAGADRPARADQRAARPDRPVPLLAAADRPRRPGARARRRRRPDPGHRRP